MPSEENPVRRVVVVGGVAGGASAAARLRRLDDSVEIVVLERSGYVSFANCGLPYHLSATIPDRDDLLLQSPESLRTRFALDVRVLNEVTGIDRNAQVLTIRRLTDGTTYELHYDALILSPGAAPIVPDIPGAERGFVLRDVEDLDRLVQQVQGAKNAVIVGGGFIGLEAAENLSPRLKVRVVELGDQLLAPLDPEMASPLARELTKHGIEVDLNCSVVEVGDGFAVLSDGRRVPADLVLFAIGVRPDTGLANSFGIDTGDLGGIAVDDEMRTSDPHIWAVGDATEKIDIVDGQATLTPLANIANRQGRRAADAILGHSTKVLPSQGTAIVKVFNLVVATTGWNEKRLRRSGRNYLAIHTHPTSNATYYPGAEQLTIKLLMDPTDGVILGAQAVGGAGVDKRIDVLATAMRAGITAPDLLDLELAYAPPFGSAKDPINVLGYIAENRMAGHASADWSEVDELVEQGWLVLDVRTIEEFAAGAIPNSLNIPLDELRARLTELPSKQLIVNCAAGQRAHVASAMLSSNGYDARTLDGGWNTWLAGARATNSSAG